MSQVDEILARLRFCLGAKNDTELAEILEIPYKTLDGWKTRGAIPESRIQNIVNLGNISRDWLLNGGNTIHGGNNQIGNLNTQNNGVNEIDRGEIWTEFVKLFDEYGSNAMLRKFIERLEEEKEKFAKGE